MDDLYRRYAGAAVAGLTSEQVAVVDRRFFAARRLADLGLQVIGLDIAAGAVSYARQVGLIDYASIADLTTAPPDERFASLLSGVDLVFESGGVFPALAILLSAVLGAMPEGRHPWIVIAPTRLVDLADTRSRLAAHGLELRPAGDLFPYRRFADERERARCLALLESRVCAGTEIEKAGYYAARLHVAGPPAQGA
jgi:hypothetical protein